MFKYRYILLKYPDKILSTDEYYDINIKKWKRVPDDMVGLRYSEKEFLPHRRKIHVVGATKQKVNKKVSYKSRTVRVLEHLNRTK